MGKAVRLTEQSTGLTGKFVSLSDALDGGDVCVIGESTPLAASLSTSAALALAARILVVVPAFGISLLDLHWPQWRESRAELNVLPLGV